MKFETAAPQNLPQLLRMLFNALIKLFYFPFTLPSVTVEFVWGIQSSQFYNSIILLGNWNFPFHAYSDMKLQFASNNLHGTFVFYQIFFRTWEVFLSN